MRHSLQTDGIDRLKKRLVKHGTSCPVVDRQAKNRTMYRAAFENRLRRAELPPARD
jgi:hypothetical protein